MRGTPDGVKSWFNQHLKCLLIGAAVITAVGIAGGFAISDALSIPRNNLGNCTRASTEPHGKTGLPGAGSGTLVAKLREGQREEVDFGRSSVPKLLALYLDLSTPVAKPTYFAVRADQFVRTDDAALQPQDIAVSALGDGSTLIVDVCFLRGDGRAVPLLGDPGSYVGSVTVDDSRLRGSVTIPVVLTMQFTNGGLLLWLYFGAIIPGIWCLWVINAQRTGTSKAFSCEIFQWLLEVRGVVSVVVGGVAAFAVYTATYLHDPTWGSSALQPLTLFGAMFSAFVTTAGLAHLSGGSRIPENNAAGPGKDTAVVSEEKSEASESGTPPVPG